MEFSQLRDANPDTLQSFIDKWRSAAQILKSAGSEATANAKSLTATWQGESATEAQQRISRGVHQLDVGYVEATTTAQIIVDAQKSFVEVKKKLTDVLAEIAEDDDLTVNEDGTVKADSEDLLDVLLPFLFEKQQAEAEAKAAKFTQRIKQILTEAQAADFKISQQLLKVSQASGKDRNEFNANASFSPLTAKMLAKFKPPVSVGEDTSLLFGKFGLSREEADLLRARTLPLPDALTIQSISEEAVAEGKARFNGSTIGKSDAFRHVYANALLTQRFGEEWTQQFTTAHEGPDGNSPAEKSMDLHNNQYGRNLGLKYPTATGEELAAQVQKAIDDGHLLIKTDKEELIYSDGKKELSRRRPG